MSSQLQLGFATSMAPADQTWWWYYGLTGVQVAQLLTENKAMLTRLDAYVDTDNTLKLSVIMQPATEQWWWWYGVSADQVGQYLAQNKAQLTDISAFIDTDHQLKFAVIMRPGTGTGWWYGCTAAQVGDLLTQNKARIAAISAYIDTDNSVKFAFAAVPAADQTWWWYYGDAAFIGQQLTSHKAMLTDLSAYVESGNTVNFVAVMAPANQAAWWYFGSPSFIGQELTDNKARLTALSPYLVGPAEMSFSGGTGSGTTSSGATECAYDLNLTLKADGTCHFWGSYTNRGDVPIITAPSQTFGVSMVVLDTNGKGYSFSAGGQVPSAPQKGCTYAWNQTTKSPEIAANWSAIAARNYANYGYQNQASIVEVLGEILGAVATVAKDVGIVVGAITAVMALGGGGQKGTGAQASATG